MTDYSKHDNTIIMKSISKYLIAFPALALIILAGCGAPNGDETADTTESTTRERIVAVETMTVEQVRFEDRIRINGNVSAFEDAMISVETPGQVLFIAERGTNVKKGDVILRLDDRLLQANYQATKTGYELALDAFNRQNALYADSVISTMQYLQAKAQKDQAASQLTAIEKQLEDAALKAPFSGRIEEKLTSEGQFVGPGTPVLRLVNTNQVKISGGVPERYAGIIKAGSEVEVQFRSYGLESRTAQIRFAGNLINPESRTFPVEIVLNNTNGSIKPSMVVEMRVTRSELEESIIVPRTAVIRNDEGLSIFVVTNDNGTLKATQQTVTLSLSSGDYVVVDSGLNPGDQVVTAGFTNLSNGDLVNVIATRSTDDLLK
ncbi:MAG TPA: hypothetical protein DCE78_09285 [Bacteroidetes bacterium]|nr:hypothetical protein [Bacteroidota bacterium]